MELSQIKYFLAVAETLNFTNAAKACAVSQPALSKAIRKLEETLGGELFVRNRQQVELTDFGHTMRVHFERVEDARQKAFNAARFSAAVPTERLGIGVMCTIGPRRFGQFLEAFRQDNPRFEITLHDVVSETIPELLLSGAMDCAFSAANERYDTRFESVLLFEEKMVVAFADSHRFAEQESVPLAEIAKEFYLDRLHCEFRDEFMNFTRASGLELAVGFSSEREDWILELVRQGLGVSVMPEDSIILDSVAHRPITDITGARKLNLVMTQNATASPALTKFHDAAQAFDWR